MGALYAPGARLRGVGCTPFGEDMGSVLRGAPRLDAIGVEPARGVAATPDPTVDEPMGGVVAGGMVPVVAGGVEWGGE